MDTVVSTLSSPSSQPHNERRRENEDTFDENEGSHAKIDLGSPSKHSNKTTSSRVTSSRSSHKSLRLINLASGTGTKGNAFARVDNVEVISRSGNSVILHPMTVLFPESKVTAIMGPSGSGNSTLLNFLTGTIVSNLHAEGLVNLSGQMGFVPQEDHLHGFYSC